MTTERRETTSSLRLLGALLAAAVIMLYLPSLDHLPRGDQRCVLADSTGAYDAFAAVNSTISYNRTRAVAPGDPLLFRPIYFLQLGIQRLLFGDHFMLWQATGIILHLLVLWRLWALMTLWVHPRVALGLTTAFALAAANTECVTWNHINGYLTFQVFALTGWRHAEIAATSPGRETRRVWLAAGHLLLASLSYEFGAVIAGILALRLWHADRSTSTATSDEFRARPIRFRIPAWSMLLAVPLIYVALSSFDYVLRLPYIPSSLEDPGTLPSVTPSLGLALISALRFWTFALLVPTQYSLLAGVDRTIAYRVEPGFLQFFADPMVLGALAGYVACAIAGALLRPSNSSPATRRLRAHELAVPFLLIASYTIMIAQGRLCDRGLRTLNFNFSWVYAYAVLLAILVAAILSFVSIRPSLYSRVVHALAGAGLLFLALNIPVAWRLNNEFRLNQEPARTLLAAVGEWRRAHESEPGFSFRFVAKPPADTWHDSLPPGFYTYQGTKLDLNSYVEVIHGDVISPNPLWTLAWEPTSGGSGTLRAVRSGGASAPVPDAPGTGRGTQADSHGRPADAPLVSPTP